MDLEAKEVRHPVLITGSRHWPWSRTVHKALDHLHRRHGQRLVVVEGCATGADAAAHDWCLRHNLSPERHRCYPVDWKNARRTRPDWQRAGNERNTAMLKENPCYVVAFHASLECRRGGTSDMCLKALLIDIPVWLVQSDDVCDPVRMSVSSYPKFRVKRAHDELKKAGLV